MTTQTEATQYIKATLTAFGPDEAISMTQETWAKLHEAMKALAEQPAQQQCEYCKRGLKAGVCYCKPAQQEPLASLLVGQDSDGRYVSIAAKAHADTLPLGEYKLYTSPPQRKPLTDHQTMGMTFNHHWLTSMTLRDAYRLGIRDAEAAHGIK